MQLIAQLGKLLENKESYSPNDTFTFRPPGICDEPGFHNAKPISIQDLFSIRQGSVTLNDLLQISTTDHVYRYYPIGYKGGGGRGEKKRLTIEPHILQRWPRSIATSWGGVAKERPREVLTREMPNRTITVCIREQRVQSWSPFHTTNRSYFAYLSIFVDWK